MIFVVFDDLQIGEWKHDENVQTERFQVGSCWKRNASIQIDHCSGKIFFLVISFLSCRHFMCVCEVRSSSNFEEISQKLKVFNRNSSSNLDFSTKKFNSNFSSIKNCPGMFFYNFFVLHAINLFLFIRTSKFQVSLGVLICSPFFQPQMFL